MSKTSGKTYKFALGDEFIFDDVIIEVTTKDPKTGEQRNVDPQAYADTLGHRLEKRMTDTSSFTHTIEEIKNQQGAVDVCIQVAERENEVTTDQLVAGLEAKGRITVKTEFGQFVVPVPTTRSLEAYIKALSGNTAKAFQRLMNAHSLMSNNKINLDDLSRRIRQAAEKYLARVTTIKKTVVTDILISMMLERVADNYLNRMVSSYGEADIWRDPMTEGLLVVQPPANHPATFAARARTIAAKYLLDDNQVQLLKALTFSSNMRETAAAKLTLNAKLSRAVMVDINHCSEKVLAYAISEAQLTTDEILSVIFINKQNDYASCPTCQTRVDIPGVMYHGECRVVQWLIKYFFFKYDSDSQMLSMQNLIYLDKGQRAILEIIEQRANALDSPIIYERSGRYAKLEIKGTKSSCLVDFQTNPATIPGSAEWLDKQRQNERFKT